MKLKNKIVSLLMSTILVSVNIPQVYASYTNDEKTIKYNELDSQIAIVSTEDELNNALVNPNIMYIELKNDIKNIFPYESIQGNKIIEGNGYRIDATGCKYGTVFAYQSPTYNTLELNNIVIDSGSQGSSYSTSIIANVKYLKINNSILSTKKDSSSVIDRATNVEIHNTIINTKDIAINVVQNLIAKDLVINYTGTDSRYMISCVWGNISNISLNGSSKLAIVYGSGVGSIVASNISVNEENNDYPTFKVGSNCKLELSGYYNGNKYIATKSLSRTDKEGIIKENVVVKGKIIENINDLKIDYYISNEKPVITTSDRVVKVGDKFDAMSGVKVSDEEDGEITSKVNIKENTVNTSKEGAYKIVYEVKDSDGNIVTKEIKVTVTKIVKLEVVSNVETKSKSYSSNNITWSKVDNADGYEVYRATSKGGTYSLKKTIASRYTLNYTNTGLTTGKAYYYKVRAYKVVNGKKIYGYFSNVVSSSPKLSSTTAKASSSSYSSNKVTWSSVLGARGYQVYRATSKNGTYSLNKTVTSGNSLSYTNTGLTTGKTYYYKVRAYRVVDGKKVYSNYSNIVSSSPKLSIPSITLSAGVKKAYVKWAKVSGASGYQVYRATSKNGTYSLKKTVNNGLTTSYTNSSLTKGKTYYYKLRAYRTVGGKKVYSSYSSVKSIKVK